MLNRERCNITITGHRLERGRIIRHQALRCMLVEKEWSFDEDMGHGKGRGKEEGRVGVAPIWSARKCGIDKRKTVPAPRLVAQSNLASFSRALY